MINAAQLDAKGVAFQSLKHGMTAFAAEMKR